MSVDHPVCCYRCSKERCRVTGQRPATSDFIERRSPSGGTRRRHLFFFFRATRSRPTRLSVLCVCILERLGNFFWSEPSQESEHLRWGHADALGDCLRVQIVRVDGYGRLICVATTEARGWEHLYTCEGCFVWTSFVLERREGCRFSQAPHAC